MLTTLCLALLSLTLHAEGSPAAETSYTNSIGMEFVLIPAGSFMMGTDLNTVYDPGKKDG